jgi:hypothetical protein
MQVFAAADLQRNSSEIQKAALRQPVFLTYHEKPRYVMLSLEDYVRLGGVRLIASPGAIPESVAARIRAIADTNPDQPYELIGGLADLPPD